MMTVAMPEPKTEWGRELVERVEHLSEEIETIAREVQKVDGIMTEMRQLSADRYTLLQAATRVDVQLTVVVKHLDQLAQDMKGFASFKTTGENLIWVIKWIFSPPLILALIGLIVVGFDLRSSVNQNSVRIGNLEQVTAKLQESTARSTDATQILAAKIEKNTNVTQQIVADIQKELKALSSFKGTPTKTHELTARFFLTKDAIQKVNKASIEFRWKLTRPIENDKVETTKATARLVPIGAGIEPTLGFSNADVQLRAGLIPDGQSCWVEVFSPRAENLAETLKTSTKVPVDITFVIPD